MDDMYLINILGKILGISVLSVMYLSSLRVVIIG